MDKVSVYYLRSGKFLMPFSMHIITICKPVLCYAWRSDLSYKYKHNLNNLNRVIQPLWLDTSRKLNNYSNFRLSLPLPYGYSCHLLFFEFAQAPPLLNELFLSLIRPLYKNPHNLPSSLLG